MLVEVVYLVLAGQSHVACECYDFHARSTDKECHVKAYLVVAGSC